MRVLVIGGTRFFGKLVVRRLLRRNDDVTILTRGSAQPDFMRDVHHIACDRRDYEAFRVAVQNEQFDVVFDNIAFTEEDVAAALGVFSGRIGHYVLTSTVSVYQDFASPRPLDEDEANLRLVPADYVGPGDPRSYAVGKRAAEVVLWDSEERQRFPFTIIRPSMVIGPEDPTGRFWFWVRRIQDGGALIAPEAESAGAFMYTFSEDLADVIVRVLDNPEAFGLAFNVAQDEVFTIDSYLESIAEAMGKTVKVVRIPDHAVQASIAGYHLPSPSRLLVQCYAAKRYLNFVPQPGDIYLKRTVDWFIEAHDGPPPRGYEQRAAEIALGERWRQIAF